MAAKLKGPLLLEPAAGLDLEPAGQLWHGGGLEAVLGIRPAFVPSMVHPGQLHGGNRSHLIRGTSTHVLCLVLVVWAMNEERRCLRIEATRPRHHHVSQAAVSDGVFGLALLCGLQAIASARCSLPTQRQAAN